VSFERKASSCDEATSPRERTGLSHRGAAPARVGTGLSHDEKALLHEWKALRHGEKALAHEENAFPRDENAAAGHLREAARHRSTSLQFDCVSSQAASLMDAARSCLCGARIAAGTFDVRSAKLQRHRPAAGGAHRAHKTSRRGRAHIETADPAVGAIARAETLEVEASVRLARGIRRSACLRHLISARAEIRDDLASRAGDRKDHHHDDLKACCIAGRPHQVLPHSLPYASALALRKGQLVQPPNPRRRPSTRTNDRNGWGALRGERPALPPGPEGA
jgi:hypothetical protein